MKKKFEKIEFNDYGYEEFLPTSKANLTHYKLVTGGIILTSNKNFKHLSSLQIFVPYNQIKIIY